MTNLFCMTIFINSKVANRGYYNCKIVLDTKNYSYRIFNETCNSLWADEFKTFEEAKEFLINKAKELEKGGKDND